MNNNMHYEHILHAVRITNNAETVEHTVWPSICKAERLKLAESVTLQQRDWNFQDNAGVFLSLGPASSILIRASLHSLFVECNRSSQTSFTEKNKGAKTESYLLRISHC